MYLARPPTPPVMQLQSSVGSQGSTITSVVVFVLVSGLLAFALLT